MKNQEEQAQKHQVIKEFGPTSLAVDNRTSVIILALIIGLFGIISYGSMPRESFPEIVIPNIYIGTFYAGNSPSDMENLVTRPIEKELKTITGVKKITSTSIQDYSTIIVEFNPDVAIPKALQDVKDAVDKSKSELPNDLPKDPNVFEISLSDLPIMFINLSGNYDLDQLKRYGEYLEDRIEQLPEISGVDIRGALEREIQIDVDLFAMEDSKVAFSDIEQAVSSENVTISGGNILAEDFRRSIRVTSEFREVAEIEDIIVKSEDGAAVYLRDIATVKDSYKERESYARFNKQPVVTLEVKKRSGENLLNAADQIKSIIEKSQVSALPKDLQISITNDQSREIKSMVSNLENSIISGVILVVGVLLFFMGLRSALFVGVAIPLSMFISFIVLGNAGVTLNIMVLFSLILALGMLVDNGIVVIENIYRLREDGYPLKRAVKEGVGEIAWAIISSTATTVAAFLPLAFWGGILGQFMRFLPITLIIVLSASLFVALVINPAVVMIFSKEGDLEAGKKAITVRRLLTAGAWVLLAIPLYILQATQVVSLPGQYTVPNLMAILGVFLLANMLFLTSAAQSFQDNVLPRLESFYSRIISYAVTGARPYFFLVGTVFLLVFSFVLLSSAGLKVLFFPENEPNYINIFVEKPIGTDIETTNELAKKVESRVIEMMKPYDYMIDAIITQVGEGTSEDGLGGGGGVTPHKAKIAVSFKEFEFRKGKNTSDILEDIRAELKNYPGVQITVAKDRNGPPVGAPVSIEVVGEDYAKLIATATRIRRTVDEAAIPGIEQLKLDLETGKPELIIHVDRDKARRLGLSSASVAMELRTALFGKEVSKFKDGKDDHPIQLRLREDQRHNLEALLNKSVTFRNNRGRIVQIPISTVVDIEYNDAIGSIKRKDLDRVIMITSNVKEGYNPTEIVDKVKDIVGAMSIPEGYTVKFTGEQEEQEKTADFLGKALMLAVFMVFLIIVTQFNSLTAPVVIISSIIFSTIGVFLGLVIFQMDFVVLMTGIGIISLAGVVVNNAIVLIDYTNLLRSRRKAELGIDEEDPLPYDEFLACIVEAGKKRLRPVLLTAITTILGLIPLAIGLNIDFIGLLAKFDANIYFGGDNAAFWGPMAWTVIFGLSFATFLTLVVVPVMYLLTAKLTRKTPKHRTPSVQVATSTNGVEKTAKVTDTYVS
jgi:multidrug efflux pump subunit AcrB